MQTLRKKTSPLKYKNETTRFLGDGVSFKAKLIGILEVSEARGDRMCQEALSDLKMAIRAAGEHKQRITIHIALDGLRLRDEKTGDSLYHHPVHKISFIAQDMTDSRAFGYIFGSPDTGHRFFGIKTDKAASQVVIAMRDLFQVVFALKKKEIELAKIHLEKTRFPTSPIFSENPGGSSKLQSTTQDKSTSESKASASAPEAKSSGTAVADLVDLELELSSLQQGLNQMERITPSDPFGSKDDPFGDSFISYPKPILPPPPSSGRERSSRTSETSSLFSPKTPHTAASLDTSAAELNLICGKKDFSFSHDFSSSREEPSSGDWFTPSAGNSLFEEPPLVPPEPSKDEKHELAKQEILSQFDVFTELDPLGTGRSKPYIDKKHFFQELKNPPKKVLNDLVSNNQNQAQDQNLFPANFNQISQQQTKNSASYTNSSSVFTNDPFGEDPFVKEDPFAEADFSKQDPFETEYNDKFFPKDQNNLDKFKFDSKKTENLQTLLQNSNLSRSPKSSLLEKQSSVPSTSPRTVQFSQHNTFDAQFDKLDDKKMKLTQLHENPSLDMSSESECAPEPPPRPASTLMQIKPPPLPPKKQNDLAIKPPPRPPHTEDPHYDYMDNYETAPNSIEYVKNIEKSPPLPVPARKSKFESDFTIVPERPKKHFNLQSSEEDYLTPITFSDSGKNGSKEVSGNIYLPPPQKSTKKLQQQQQNMAQVTVASYLESKPNLTTSVATDKLNSTLEGLDITLSQLTLSGLNELATKLNIPSSQLSNMTLVQLTNYLSNFVKSSTTATESNTQGENSFNSSDFPAFQADFAANFNNLNNAAGEMYDRYAVFRELMQEEIKQTKIDTEPEQLQEEKQEVDNSVNSNLNTNPLNDQNNSMIDKYAALREIVEIELKQSDTEKSNENESTENIVEEQNTFDSENNENIDDINIANKENKFNVEDKERDIISSPQNPLIEYTNSLDNKDTKVTSPLKSPKSPIKQNIVKSPIPSAISEIIQTNTRLTSGSLSDVISGSSPEIDNTANSDSGKKTSDAAGESWAIFDQANLRIEAVKETEKQAVQSEEGVSPWSSDSKEFGNGSPPDWRGDAPEEKWSKRRRDQEGGWWDTAAEPETQYYPSNRRSTDSYEDEYYECYDRPRRRRQGNWSSGQAAGGHSSSSRDVSPWEEEPRRREARESRPGWGRHQRQQSFERHKDRVHTDSWDEEDDYEYDDEHGGRFHWSERHSSRESDRHSAGSREHEDRWTEERNEDRRHRRRRDRWCCPDWDQTEHEKSLRYSGRWTGAEGPPVKWRDRKHDPRYYSRDSQESPWEDEYANEPEETHSNYYLQAKRNWKQRPSSASEMDRKTGEIKSRHYIGGSDGERDRRYKSVGRRSRSRDSQYSEPPHKHKSELGPPIRNPHRTKPHPKSQPQVDTEFIEGPSKKIDNSKLELSNKKSSTLAIRKKSKESLKTEETAVSTFPRKSTSRAKSLFENDFMTTEASATSARIHSKLNFDNEFETSEAESPTLVRPLKGIRQHSLFEKEQDLKENRPRIGIKESKLSPRYQSKAKSLFEDDFSPSEKSAAEVQLPEDNSISSIKEENDPNEEEDSFSTSNFENATNSRKKILSKNRLSNSMRTDINLKKSESVNIFARESDPFDDDFFCGNVLGNGEKSTLRNTELRWTDDFDDFDTEDKK